MDTTQYSGKWFAGIGNKWDDVIIPVLDFVVIENTLGKFGKRVEDLTAVPRYAQPLVGSSI